MSDEKQQTEKIDGFSICNTIINPQKMSTLKQTKKKKQLKNDCIIFIRI